MSVDRIFGTCSEHGSYELPLASVERGDVYRGCPGCRRAIRREVLWSIAPDVAPITVYADEVAQLEVDAVLYGNVFVKQNLAGVYARVRPDAVDPDYACGAAYCDDPACNTHGPKGRDA